MKKKKLQMRKKGRKVLTDACNFHGKQFGCLTRGIDICYRNSEVGMSLLNQWDCTSYGTWQHSGELVVQPYLDHPRLSVPIMKHGDLTRWLECPTWCLIPAS